MTSLGPSPQGWDPAELIRDFGDPADEARACRSDCALFDFSFIARASIEGPEALACIGRLTGRPLQNLAPGQVCYALHTDLEGHLLSDLTIWRLGRSHYEVMSGRPEDIAALAARREPGAVVADLTAETAILALQGPKTLAALQRIADTQRLGRLDYFTHCRTEIAGISCRVGRLGYTGESGFEIVLPRRDRMRLWDLLSRRARPAGFAAADILRIEAGFALFANEFRVPVTARQAGLSRFAGDTGDTPDPEIGLICFQATADHMLIPWQPSKPMAWPPRAGTIAVTSACDSVTAGTILGLGYARLRDVETVQDLSDPTATFHDIRKVSLPFYDSVKQRPRADWYPL